MTRIFRVKFESQWNGDRMWEKDTWDVAAKDAEEAFARVKANKKKDTYTAEDTGRKYSVVGVRMLGVELIAETDI